MKGHKGHRGHKAAGGKMDSPASGSKEWEEDLRIKPEARTNAAKIDAEAEERKHGGRAKRRHGGMVKHLGKVHGKKPHMHAGKKPRAAGGRTGSNFSPLSSAHRGTEPKAHHSEEID